METVCRKIRTLLGHPIAQGVVVCIIGFIVWQLCPDSHDLLTGIFAALIAVFYTLYLDRQTRAKLETISIPNENDNEQQTPTLRKFLHLNVTNPPLWTIHSWFQRRHTAAGTSADIEFYPYPDKTAREFPKPIFIMPGKWRENQIPDFGDDYKRSKELPRGFFDTRDIASGKGIRNHLDIAMKISGDNQCYGWNLENLLYDPPNRNPKRELGDKHYLVKVALRTAGEHFDDYFELLNDSDYAQFKLNDIIDREKKRIKSIRPDRY